MITTVLKNKALDSICYVFLFLSLVSCNQDKKQFTLIKPSASKIDFVNTVFGEEEIDIMENSFYHNGAGVMVADFDNDGLEDVFFSGNHVPSRLYKNDGNLSFRDITKESGLLSDLWATGVTFADVNGDGFQDIYICTVGEDEANLFYEHQGLNEKGIPWFKEKAADYGINLKNVSTQAAFFDYDKDDDLDLVVAVNSQIMNYRNHMYIDTTAATSKKTREFLFRNNADGSFTDVSEKAGIIKEGSSLGLAINDLNNDGWADIYIANDFISNDLVYINNQDGTFTDKAKQYLRHTTFHGMGVDITDINADGLMDITVLDMLPESDQRRKRMQMPINYDLYQERIRLGYLPQFVRNTFQLNQGTDANGVQNFSEIGCQLGIQATDWSWAPLWADYDNDGLLDLFITNGYPKDTNDLDHMFGLDARISIGTAASYKKHKIKAQNARKPVFDHNYFYKNLGNMRMEEISKDIGLEAPSISFGVAFADLDNDGDLELITNNFKQEVFLYKNNTITDNQTSTSTNFLKVKLQYKGKNTNGLGTTLKLSSGDSHQTYFHSYVRGYMSSMGETIHFGLGNRATIDSLTITWPNNKRQVLTNISINTTHKITYAEAPENSLSPKKVPSIFENVTDTLELHFTHKENKYVDFKNEPLLYKMYSKEGPALAVGDLNGDHKDDIIMGGAFGQQTTFFMQNKDGFEMSNAIADIEYEDMGILVFDADNDKDLDIYIASGGSEQIANSKHYQDRLYFNDGQGNFTKSENIPEIRSSGGPVKGADYDKDGDIDLFVGGKVNIGAYPTAPRSYLLQNKSGVLSDQTPKDLKFPGMITDAIWSDFDNDGWIDLILVGEWMEITIFKNNKGTLTRYQDSGLKETSGWWNSIAGGDFDQDGDIDYIVGNLGTNTTFEASPKEPLRLYAGDFDNNNKIDPVLTYYSTDPEGNRREMVFHNRDAMSDQIVGFKRRFKDYYTYSIAPFRSVLTEKETADAQILDAQRLTSSYIENLGNGKFKIKNLPWECQMAPMNGIVVKDFNNDGYQDVFSVGNAHTIEPIYGKLDAALGLLMMNTGKGEFNPIPAAKSGLYLKGDQKSIAIVTVAGKDMITVGTNSGNFIALQQKDQKESKKIKLQPLDCYALVTFTNGNTMKKEFYYGNSYLSQSSRQFNITPDMQKVVIFDTLGSSRQLK